MNPTIETLNHWGGWLLNFAWPMLWQSSLLMLVLFAIDFAIRRRIRASIRYALWLVVLVKLCLPTTLALPTSPAWWWHKAPPIATAQPHYTVTDGAGPLPDILRDAAPVYAAPKPTMTIAAWLLVASAGVSVLLFAWLLVRWWHVARRARRSTHSERLTRLLNETGPLAHVKSIVPVKLTENTMSPAVCGLFHPVILIPTSLAERFSGEQLRVVLLHELIHLRRRDVWVHFLQSLLQIVYWWHPLLWLANARIRRVREEAVDDAVMLALRDDATSYAPTLLEVAKLALNRPLASLGLVGILESRSALRQRIERLMNFHAPRKAGLTFVSFCCIFAFSAVALPMGEAPGPAGKLDSTDATAVEQQSLTLKVNPGIFIQNIKAQAAKSLMSPTNDYTAVLLDMMRGEGVDCAPPNGIAFNTRTGEITTQNTPDKLDVFRRVIEQLNRADGQCRLPLGNNPLRQNVVIEARIYQMPDNDFEKYVSGLQFYHGNLYGDDWWSASPEKFRQLVGKLESSGLQLIQRPRIQTASGITAEFFVGNGTNSIEFDSKPYVADGFVDLALRGTVVGVTPASAAFTNQFSTRASAEDRGGIVVRVKKYGGDAGNNLVVVIGVEIVTNAQTGHFQTQLQPIIIRQNSSSAEARSNGQPRLAPGTGMTPGSTGFVEGRRVTIPDNAPQIHIKGRFMEVPKGTLDGFGKMVGGTNQPDQFVGILTSENANTAMKALESRAGGENLAEPEGTTTSGRQMQMRATQIITVITNFAFGETSTNSYVLPQTSQVETGPVLNTVATVLPDGYTIDLRAIASLTTFFGYADPTNFSPRLVTNSTGEKITFPIVLPAVQIRRASAHLRLFDGQTLVLSGFHPEQVLFSKPEHERDQRIAEHIQQHGEPQNGSKTLIVLVTATLEDATGKRLHSDNEMSFAKNAVPPPPQNGP